MSLGNVHPTHPTHLTHLTCRSAEACALRCRTPPDLPDPPDPTREETERRMYEAIQLHVEGLIEDKQPVPVSTSFAEYVVMPA